MLHRYSNHINCADCCTSFPSGSDAFRRTLLGYIDRQETSTPSPGALPIFTSDNVRSDVRLQQAADENAASEQYMGKASLRLDHTFHCRDVPAMKDVGRKLRKLNTSNQNHE